MYPPLPLTETAIPKDAKGSISVRCCWAFDEWGRFCTQVRAPRTYGLRVVAE